MSNSKQTNPNPTPEMQGALFSRKLDLTHTFKLDPSTRTYIQEIGTQVFCTAGHLALHTSLKGVMFTILEFLYRVCHPLLGKSPTDVMADYIWPFIEKAWVLTKDAASKVRNCGVRNPEAIQAEMQSDSEISPDGWAALVPIGGGMAAIVAALVFGKSLAASSVGMKEFKHWTEYAAGLSKAKNGIKTVVEFANWVVDYTRECMMRYCPELSISKGSEKVFAEHDINIKEYMLEVMYLTNPTNRDAVMRDPQTSGKLVLNVALAGRILKLLAAGDLKVSQPMNQSLTTLRSDLYKLASEFSSGRSAQPKRPTPYHVSIFGASGVGKSDIAHRLVYDITDPEWFTVPVDRDVDGRITVYPRSASDKYWSNYAGQGAVILDDFGQSAQDTPDSSEYLALIYMMTGVAFMPPMAAVGDKGRLFTSRVVVSTTNQMFPTSLCVKTSEALWRRRNILVEAFSDPSKDLDDPSRMTFTLYDPCPRSGKNACNTPTLLGGAKQHMTYAELIAYIVPRMNAFCERDEKAVLVKSGLTQLDRDAMRAEMHSASDLPIRDFGESPEIEEDEQLVPFHEYCDCCEEPLEFAWSGVCCINKLSLLQQSEWWRALDVVEDVNHSLVACCYTNTSYVSSHIFDRVYEDTPQEVKDCFYKSLLVGDLRLDGLPYIYPDISYGYEDLIDPLAEEHLDQGLPVAVQYRELQHYWNLMRDVCGAGKYCFVEGSCPPRGFRLWPLYFQPEPLVVEMQGMVEDLEADAEKKREELITQERHQRIIDGWTAEDHDEVLALLEQEESTRVERFIEWCQNEGNYPMMMIFRGIGVALTGFAAWKAYKWLNNDAYVDVKDVQGNVHKIKRQIDLTFTGVAKHMLLDYLMQMTIVQIADGYGASKAKSAVMEGMVSYDSRSKYQRAPKNIRMALHSGEQAIVEIYVKCLREANISEEVIEDFQEKAVKRIREATSKVEMEGCSDNRTREVMSHKIQARSLVTCQRIRKNGENCTLQGFGVMGKILLLPYHFFHDLEHGDETEYYIHSRNGISAHSGRMGVEIRRCDSSEACPSRDVCLVNLGARAESFPNIMEHFIREEDLPILTSTLGVVNSRNINGVFTEKLVTIRRNDIEIEYGDATENYVVPQSWAYGMVSEKGMCGAVVACLNKFSKGCIMGMHVAGLPDLEQSFGAIITNEWLMANILEKFPMEAEMHCAASPDDGEVFARHPTMGCAKFSELTVESVEYPTIVPVGAVKQRAYLKSKYAERVSSKTDLVPSPLFDMVVEHVTEPSVLHPNDARMDQTLRDEKYSPINEGAKKFSERTKPFSKYNIEIAASLILSTLMCYVPKGVTKRLLTVYEAINGIQGAGFSRLNPVTSPGVPFKWWRPAGSKGKRWLFDCKEVPGESLEMRPRDEYLVSKQLEMHQQLLKGEQPFVLAYSNLKDERRGLAKIRSGATRLFDCLPLHFNIECRMFFGAFIACMNQNCTQLPSAVGIDCTSPQWTHLYNRLNRFGGNVIAGDYKAWDGKLCPDIMERAADVISDWYDDGPINRRARRILIQVLIFLKTIYGNVVAAKSQGIPSGTTLTADLNGLCNWFYMLIALITIADEKKIKIDVARINDNIESTFYGDDHVWAPSPEYQKFFNFNTVQEFFTRYHINYTDALKRGGAQPDFMSLKNETSYLKRRWSPHFAFTSRMLAPLDTDTIHEEINWIRRVTGPDASRDAVVENINTAMHEAFHHGDVYFNDLKRKCNEAISILRQEELSAQGSSRWSDITHDFRTISSQWIENFV